MHKFVNAKENVTISRQQMFDDWEHEWHLYSAVIITAVLTFISIQIASGTSQTIGIAFSGLVGTFLFTSGSWKRTSIKVHQLTMTISIFALLTTVTVSTSVRYYGKN